MIHVSFWEVVCRIHCEHRGLNTARQVLDFRGLNIHCGLRYPQGNRKGIGSFGSFCKTPYVADVQHIDNKLCFQDACFVHDPNLRIAMQEGTGGKEGQEFVERLALSIASQTLVAHGANIIRSLGTLCHFVPFHGDP